MFCSPKAWNRSLLLLVCSLFFFLLCKVIFRSKSNFIQQHQPNDSQKQSNTKADFQLGLYWTSFFDEDPFNCSTLFSQISVKEANLSDFKIKPSSSNLYRPKLCEKQYSRCFFTSDRSFAFLAQSIVIHWRDFSDKMDDLPQTADFYDYGNNPIQASRPLWTLLNVESPAHVKPLPKMYFDSWQLKLLTFDLVANYKTDAHLVTPYGRVVPKRGNLSSSNNFGNQVTGKLSSSFQKKSKQAAWFVSNCKTVNKREKYVEELIQQHNVSVDIYGKCASLWNASKSCKPTQSSVCYEQIEREYRFYLSFENSICRDYVTEKAFNILKYNLLPVVRGGANYSAFLPPHSYIDASKMTPSELAQLLHRLTEREDEYEAYFKWKGHYEVVSEDINSKLACQLCEAMQQRQKNGNSNDALLEKISSKKESLPSPVTAEQINSWYFDESNCNFII